MGTYVRFLPTDNNSMDDHVVEVESRDPREVSLPPDTFAFYFFDADTAKLSPMRNQSGIYCYGNEVEVDGERKLELPNGRRTRLREWHTVLGTYDAAPRTDEPSSGFRR
jgi:hypothetical protein